ncbi:MAG: hypothetical protein Q7S83_01805 [bacterium]|nr:hypothetical protein [bacterium]
MKRVVGFLRSRGDDSLMSPGDVIGDFYRPGWVFGVFYEEADPGIQEASCLVTEFTGRFLRVLNSTRSQISAFQEGYDVLMESGRRIENFVCFLVSGDGIWFAAADEAKLLRVRVDGESSLIKIRPPAQQVLESGFTRPKIDWEMIDDQDLYLVSGNSNLFSVLDISEISRIVRECCDPEKSAEALVKAAQKKLPRPNYSAVVVPLK